MVALDGKQGPFRVNSSCRIPGAGPEDTAHRRFDLFVYLLPIVYLPIVVFFSERSRTNRGFFPLSESPSFSPRIWRQRGIPRNHRTKLG